MKNYKLQLILVLLLSVTSACVDNRKNDSAVSGSSVSYPLADTIANLDSAFFGAFNRRDIAGIKNFLAEELEFYHDLGGVTNYGQNIEAFERNFHNKRKLRRELVKGSMEVSPIKDFGAVQLGEHLFYVTEEGEKEKLSSKAKFVHLWQNKNGSWKITRIISYAHLENL